jgi:glycosyltransferase involved in cell wall biosynthesis
MKRKLIRITTVPISLDKLLEGQLAFMKDNYEVIAVSSSGTTLTKVSEKEGVRVVAIEMSRKITPFKDLKSLWQLYRLFNKEKPWIVHTHTPKAGTLGMLAAKLAGVPNRLHTVAGLPLLEATGLKRMLLNAVEKVTYACASKIYPNSYGLKDIILNNKFTKKTKLKVLGNGSSNGINTSYFNPQLFSQTQNEILRQELNIDKEDYVFIFVGRLVSDKGINELIAAYKELQSTTYSHPELVEGEQQVKLLLVGPFESDLDPLKKETLNEIESNSNIITVGFQQDVRPYFAVSDALVFPSYREGFPNVVMQAGAMELPSIVTNINGCNEIIINGANGIIIPVKDSHAVYKAMKKMAKDECYRKELEKNARSMIVERYEQQLVWNAILEEYKKLENNV